MSIVKLETDDPNKTPRKTPSRSGVSRKKPATASAKPTDTATRPKQPATISSPEREMVVADPTREEIALRAYELYVARGRRDGHSDEDWARAERELNAERERARIALRQPSSRSTTES